MAEKKKEQDEAVALPIDFHYPEDQTGLYSNYALVQNGQFECQISFFDIKPPVLLGTPEEIQEQVKKLTHVSGNCVARIIVAKEFVPLLIATLQDVSTKGTSKHDIVSKKGSG